MRQLLGDVEQAATAGAACGCAVTLNSLLEVAPPPPPPPAPPSPPPSIVMFAAGTTHTTKTAHSIDRVPPCGALTAAAASTEHEDLHCEHSETRTTRGRRR